MPSLNLIELSVGLEATAGTPVARTKTIPVSGLAGLDRVANTGPDPAIVGLNMDSGDYMLFADVAGDIPLAIRPAGAIGIITKSLLGDETDASPKQIGACVRMKYTGSEYSCKFSASASVDNIRSLVGVKGAETGDTNFGTSGTLSLTAAASDTVGELVTVVDGYTDYSCEKVFGKDAYDLASNDVVSISALQGKNNWTYIFFDSADSGCYRHEFTVDLGTDERPTMTIQKDGYGLNTGDGFVYAGCVAESMNVNGALKAMVEGSVSVYGFTEATGQTYYTGAALEDYDPIIFYKGDFSLGGNSYNFTRNFDLTFTNNHNADGYGGGSLDRQYHQKGMFGTEGSIQVRLDATSAGERNKIFSNTAQAALALEFQGDYIENTATTQVPEFMLVELPYCSLTSYEFTENAGVIDATIGLKAVSPKGTTYNDPVKITIINEDSAAY